jgi:hypothetical protein
MKTPIQEVYENFNKMSDADFKAWMLNTDLLEKERGVIKNAYIEGCGDNILCESTDKKRAEEYYNETFNTKEK